MPGLAMRDIFGRFFTRAEAPALQATPDQELLARFLNDRDEEAFAALMQIHAGMVLGVCQRILRNAHDAEDACQAVFLILAQQGRSIRKTGSLASWLHGAAWRVANKLRTRQARRTARESKVAAEKPTEAEPADMSWREVLRLVDEELNRLPREYRAPLVLCYLEGRTQDEAARELGWSFGAVRGRLVRGRELLRSRLARRGVTGASAVAITALVPSLTTAAVPPTLITSTSSASVPLACGDAMPATVSARAAQLARESLPTPLTAKVAIAIAILVSAVILGSIALVFFGLTADQRPSLAGTTKVWKEAGQFDIPDSHVWCVAYSKDGKRIAAGSGGPLLASGELRVWDADTQRVLFVKPTVRSVRCVVFAPDGKTLVTAEHDGAARLRDAATGEVTFTLRGHRTQIDTAAFSIDGKTLATTGWDGTVRLWEALTGKELRTLSGTNGQVFTVAFGGPDGMFASGGADGTARIWHPQSDEPRFILQGHTDTVHWLAFSPDGKTLATAGWDRTVRLWDAATGNPRAVLEGHAEQVLVVAFSPDGRTLASSASAKYVKDVPAPAEVILWDVQNQKPRTRFTLKDRVYGLTFSPDGTTLAIAGWDGRVTFWQESPENPDDPSAPSNVGDLHFVQAAAQPDALEPPPSKQYAEEFHPTLKGNAAAIPGLAIYGPDADACVKFEPEGLRVSLPIGYPRQRPGTGAITDFGVKGDLDISMTFEILPQAKPGLLNGRASLKLMLVPKEEPIPEVWTKANKNRAGLSRDFSSLNNAGSFVANVTQWTGEIPKDQWNNETFTKVEQSSGTLYPAIASTGRLRLVRSGSALYFFTSDGDDADFILRRKDEFGSKDLKNVRILASTGGPDASLNVRVTDLQIRADALLKATQQAFVPPTAERRSWLLPICAVALLVFLMASVAGAVLVALKRRGAAPVKSAPPKKAPAPFVFPCPECGKRLKTKTHQAGKKLKCPHCAAAVAIPKAGAETGKKPS